MLHEYIQTPEPPVLSRSWGDETESTFNLLLARGTSLGFAIHSPWRTEIGVQVGGSALCPQLASDIAGWQDGKILDCGTPLASYLTQLGHGDGICCSHLSGAVDPKIQGVEDVYSRLPRLRC